MFFDSLVKVLSEFWVFILNVTTSNSFPKPLKAEEELECIELIRKGDKAARHKLIEHNLRLVAHIVKKYYASTGDPDDLISIGTIGLIKGIDSFNADKGAKLSSYISRCIENAIIPFRL